MIETFYGLDQLWTPAAFFAALVIGVTFGFVLERAGFGSSRRLADVFYFRNMAVIKVMFTAIVTAMLGLAFLFALGWLSPTQVHMMPTVYGAHIVGGLIFGVGFVMSGWCPGTSVVGVASGKLDGLVYLAGVLIGSVVFNEAFQSIKPLYNWGLLEEPSVAFGVPTTIFIFFFTLVGVVAFFGSEWLERRFGDNHRLANQRFLKAMSVGFIGLAAALFIFPIQPAIADANGNLSSTKLDSVDFSDQALMEFIESEADHIEPEEVANRLMNGDVNLEVIDIRSASEYQRFHMRGAVNVPLADLFVFVDSIEPSKDIVLYSNGMTHPAQARDILAQRGRSNVFMMTEGLQGFLDHCMTPVSLRKEPVMDEQSAQIASWRSFNLADTSCLPGSLDQLSADKLTQVGCGSIPHLKSVDGVFLSGQPFADDLRLAQQGGIKTVVSLRFPEELDWQEAKVAERLGLAFHNVPFKKPETLTDEVFDQTRVLLNDPSQRPLLLHCSSANRVGAVWLAHRVLDVGLSMSKAEDEAARVGLKSADYLQKAKDYIARNSGK